MNRAPIEYRTAEVTDVRERIIDLLAVPYDDWTPVDHHGQMIEESFAPGAFGSIRTRLKRSRWEVNLDHDRTRYVGRVLDLDPDDPAGLRSELLDPARTGRRPGPRRRRRRPPVRESSGSPATPKISNGKPSPGAASSKRSWITSHSRSTPPTAAPKFSPSDHDIPDASRTPTPNLDRIMAERLAADYSRSLT